MRLMLRSIGFLVICLLAISAAAQTPDLTGNWHVTIMHFGRAEYARLTLKASEGRWTGEMFGDVFTVSLNGTITLSGAAVEVKCQGKDPKGKDCGLLTGRLSEGAISATGKLYDEESSWTAQRAVLQRSAARHEFVPKVYYNEFSGLIEPALTIKPGETVHTTTVDAGGVDADGKHVAAGGNPLSGPFYIEGAWPGDTLVIKLNRVRLTRDSAGIYSNSVVLSALDPYYARDQKKVEDFDSTWKLDRVNGIAVLTKPTDRLKDFQIKLAPMMGCIGVAPPGKQSFRSGRLGEFGGNMDYNQIREGTTLYLPVFQPGALLFVGDGHAAQGDGELTGNALETSMEVEFSVDLIEGQDLGQPRAENDDTMMVMGIDNSLEEALRSATTGMSQWLESTYKLNAAEIAMVLGSSMRYDIAEVVDPQVHVVAKLSKSVLQKIAQPR